MYMNEKFFEVKNLSFSHYKSPCCLVNISFSIEKNSKTLILASKDMGKTTLLSVLSSFKDKYTGEIFFNGKELKQVSDLEKNFSFLPTEPIFFERKTVFKNINYLCKNHGLNLLEKEDLENHLSKINLSKIVCKKISKLSLKSTFSILLVK